MTRRPHPGFTTKDEDDVSLITAAMTHDSMLFFSNQGKVYQTRVWDIPEGQRTSKGKAIINVLPLQPDEKVTAILSYNQQDAESMKSGCILMCTRMGTIKKTQLSQFLSIRSSGIIAINLDKNDELLWTKMTNNKMNIILATQMGQAITFKETDVRPTGRSSQGVIGIRMGKDDVVSSMDVFDPSDKDKTLLVLSENGIGKKTKITQFPVQKRGGKGVKIANIDSRTGPIAFSSIVESDKDTLVITSRKGNVVKIPLKDIPKLSRTAKGVILMRFNKNEDAVVSATFL